MAARIIIKWPPDLDDTCKKLFALFVQYRQEYRFNEFLKLVKDSGITISKPTLIEHLNHLVTKGFVYRNEKSPRNVSYRLYWEKLHDIDKKVRQNIISKKLVEKDIENFNRISVEEQLEYVHSLLVFTNLFSIKHGIDAIIDPEKTLDFTLQETQLAELRGAVLNKFTLTIDEKGDDYTKELLSTLDEYIDKHFEYIKKINKKMKNNS